MAIPVFVDGVPAKILIADFRRAHLASFPRFVGGNYDAVIADAIDAVYDMFNGVNTMWDMESDQVWYDKTIRCYLFLTAWYIADMYPTYYKGGMVMGPLSLASKKIGDVEIRYAPKQKRSTTDEVLDSLASNVFGRNALMMLRSNLKRFRLYVDRFVYR